jgi:stalled ribosome alternative rescue factor ArfA
MKRNWQIKQQNQMDTYKSVRKGQLPQNQVERPDKGGSYRRREKFQRGWEQYD